MLLRRLEIGNVSQITALFTDEYPGPALQNTSTLCQIEAVQATSLTTLFQRQRPCAGWSRQRLSANKRRCDAGDIEISARCFYCLLLIDL